MTIVRACFSIFLAALLLRPLEARADDSEKDLQAKRARYERELAAAPDDPRPLLEVGRVYFYLSVDDEEFVEKAEATFRRLSEHGGDPGTVAMYLATLTTVRGKHSVWPIRKWNLAHEGLEAMDSVAKQYPDNFEARFIYASTLYNLPFFFHRHDAALREIHRLEAEFPAFAASNPDPELTCNVGRFLHGVTEQDGGSDGLNLVDGCVPVHG